MDKTRGSLARFLHCERDWFREFAAELVGTMFLVCIGTAAVAQVTLSRETAGTFLTVNLAFAFATALAVYICGGVSGGHINPAMTLAMCSLGRTPWRKFPVYLIAQTLGSFFGALLVYGAYADALDHFDDGFRQVYGPNATAGIFSSYPTEYVSIGTGLFDQVLGTAILSLCVLAITDQRNMEVPKHMVPLLVGFAVGMIGMSFGLNCGYPLNPARDLGPRIFTLIGGWGEEVFSFRDYNWFWVPIIGPSIGAIVGALLYELTIGVHWPASNYEVDYGAPKPTLQVPGDGTEMYVTATKFAFPSNDQQNGTHCKV